MNHYRCKHFDLVIKRNEKNTDIQIQLKNGIYSTTQIPGTYKFIKQKCPNVLKTECINPDELPFAQEVKNTEMGHLFEHILIEHIYEYKRMNGEKNVCIKAWTSWNWKQDPKGLFHITVNSCQKDWAVFNKAMERSIQLFRQLM